MTNKVFSAISKGELKKFKDKNCKITLRQNNIVAEGKIIVTYDEVDFVTNESLYEYLDDGHWIQEPYSNSYFIYGADDEDDLTLNHTIKQFEILEI